ncbi:MAG: transposase [Cellulosilyticum sp.]|nr:transposase [Cellulosilyticum sp.]
MKIVSLCNKYHTAIEIALALQEEFGNEVSYHIIETFRDFYQQFKAILLVSKRDELEKLLKIPYEDITLSKYINSLNTDYQAVLHSAQYTYSNDVVEGNVNKLKKIKRDMYNRTSIQLLRNKVIFQLLYF